MARLSEKMDREFVGLMKVLKEITSEHKDLERMNHKATGKGPELWLSAQKLKG